MSGRRDDRVTGGQNDRPSSSGPPLDGAFLLQLLRRPPQAAQPEAPPAYLPHRDPAVAAVGPSHHFLPHNFLPPPRPPASSPPPPPDHYMGALRFSPPPFDSWAPPGFPSPGPGINYPTPHAPAIRRPFFRGDPNPNSHSSTTDLRRDPRFPPRDGFAIDSQPHSAHSARNFGEKSMPNPRPEFRKAMDNSGPRRNDTFPRSGMTEPGRPPGAQPRSKGPGEWVALKGRADGGHSMEKGQDHWRKENDRNSPFRPQGDSLWRERSSSNANHDGELHTARSMISRQRDQSVDVSVEGSNGENYQIDLQFGSLNGNISEVLKGMKHAGMDGFAKDGCEETNALADRLMDALIAEKDPVDKKVMRHSDARRGKDLRSDSLRGSQVLSQRLRIRRRETVCRHDIETLAPRFLSIYESLIPADEEKAKQKQLLLSLGKLVAKEWPDAQLHLYGSCANSFGVSNSDIDICLAIDDSNMSKSEILLKLADILQSDNLQNVQALTHARVPIVKMMDPVTGISCDICVNNLLAVVNTKLLRDYAGIDVRLRQLAFIVKYWAKLRGVNETYRGTLSSYAYVLMCIHFLQLRRPAILPCLQEMEATYFATVDDTECAYFDQVEELRDFGAQNKESIARLLWAFFQYWAYYHDYTNDVISVRTGRAISKRAKDWTRRIGNDRHLICIEDPFETSHDLGRVVDKFSIKILREEFERAAYILQYDPNPGVTLFDPYVPESTLN